MLGLVVAEHVFTTYGANGEGWLSRARSSVVRASALAEMARELSIGSALLLGKGEDASGGREKVSILADAMEAVIGAVYLDGGWSSARALVVELVQPRLAVLPGGRGDLDHKSMLQEVASRQLRAKATYVVDQHGPEHDKTFDVALLLDGREWGSGSGRSKKQAEQVAARAALEALQRELGLRDDPALLPPLDDGAEPAAAPVPPDSADSAPTSRTGEPTDA